MVLKTYSVFDPPPSQCPEPIAVVGMACRLPGDVSSAEDLWKFMMEKKSGQMPEVPKNRFNINAHFHPNLERPGSINAKGGYFLQEDPMNFDPSFFGISPVEATWMDPQQRKVLEVVYEALESGGITLDEIAGSNTAVYVGTFTADFQQLSFHEPDFRHNYAATGVDQGIISNRVSFLFDLKGPSITLNTACASSMVAVHQACTALRQGDCSAAIVAGSNIVLTVDQHMNTAKLGVLSPSSTCHTFDESADGYGRAEGVGALYLKKLSDALRDSDPIRAVIRGSAVNTNGKTSLGITHPGLQGQESVIRKAYQQAGGLNPLLTGYFECHGTGTAIGDPLEVQAVAKAMTKHRQRSDQLYIGAIKTNIGHSEAASGIFALMKAILAVERGIIPPTRGIKKLNPKIPFETYNISVVTEPTPWPSDLAVRRASVNSFGYGGVNAHAIVESVDTVITRTEKGPRASTNRKTPFLYVFSAHNRRSLSSNVDRICDYATNANPQRMRDLAYTLATRRTMFDTRAFAIADRRSSERTLTPKSVIFDDDVATLPSKILFVFTGQGAQWPTMGVDLLEAFPLFHESITEMDNVLQSLCEPPSWTIEGALREPAQTSRVHDVEQSQTLCTALQIALVRLLRSWNIYPSVVVGHSSGEIAAAYTSGFLTTAQAIACAYYRGLAVKRNCKQGAMLAVGIGAEEAQPYVQNHRDVVVACHNSPQSVTLSGDPEAVESLEEEFKAAGIFARRLTTGGRAYHSPHMQAQAIIYSKLIQDSWKTLPTCRRDQRHARMVSSVTGRTMEGLSLDYWSLNLISPVLFDKAFCEATDNTIGHIIELGPHAALAGPIRQLCAKNSQAKAYHSTLLRKSSAVQSLLGLAGKMFLHKYPIDISSLNADKLPSGEMIYGQTLTDLPPYAWDYEKSYVSEARIVKEHRYFDYPRHDILGRRLPGGLPDEPLWRNILRHKDLPWLSQHRVGPQPVFPAAGYWCMAVEAISQTSLGDTPLRNITLRNVQIKSALVIPDSDEGVETLFSLRSEDTSSGWFSFRVVSIAEGHTTEHCTGRIRISQENYRSDRVSTVPALHEAVTAASWYAAFANVGFEYDSVFQILLNVRTETDRYEATATVDVRSSSSIMTDESRYVLHPSTLDALLQLVQIAVPAGNWKAMPYGFIPVEMEEITLNIPRELKGAQGLGHAIVTDVQDRKRTAEAILEMGDLIVKLSGVEVVAYEAAMPTNESATQQQICWKPEWTPDVDTLGTHASDVVIGDTADITAYNFVSLIVLKNPKSKILQICMQEQPFDLRPASCYGISNIATSSSNNVAEYAPLLTTGCATRVDILENYATDGSYDAIVVHKSCTFDVEHLAAFLKPDGYVVFVAPKTGDGLIRRTKNSLTKRFGLLRPVWEDEVAVYQKTTSMTNGVKKNEKICLVHRHEAQAITESLSSLLGGHDTDVSIIGLKEAAKAEGRLAIAYLDDYQDFLLTMNEIELEHLKILLRSARRTIWLTRGATAGSANGLARCLSSEQASLSLQIVNIAAEQDIEIACQLMVTNLVYHQIPESEFCIKQGVIWINRLRPYEPQLGRKPNESLLSYEPGQRLAIKSLSESGTFYFEPLPDSSSELRGDEVEVEVKAFGASNEGPNSVAESLLSYFQEYSGIVTATGATVSRFRVGDRICGLAQNGGSTHLVVKESMCMKIGDMEFTEAATLPIAYATANYILGDVMSLEEGSSLAVFSDTGLVGIAAIVLANMQGVSVFVVHPTTEDRELRQAGFHGTIVRNTPKGVDAVLASSGSPEAEIAWTLLAACGRYVCLGGDGMPSNFDRVPFRRGASYTAVKLETLCKRKPSRLMSAFFRLSCVGADVLEPFHPEIYNFSNIGRTFSAPITGSSTHTRVLTLEKPGLIRAMPQAMFRADSSYLLVGCLGGLGRSITSWMLRNGAKHFAFLSRSGADSAPAQQLVRDLEQQGAIVQIFRGDVSVESDVAKAVSQTTRPIRGVINAAMVLKDKLFDTMNLEEFGTSFWPKVRGTMNLHSLLTDQPLDFFIMTSSISGIIGTPTQSNYAAGNAFMDAMAELRQSIGLPAVSIALPMILEVGYVSEHQEIEDSLERKGLYGIDESEMLSLFEMAVGGCPPVVVGGLDPARLSHSLEKSNKSDPFWLQDCRLSHVRAAVETRREPGSQSAAGSGDIMATIRSADDSIALPLCIKDIETKIKRMLLLTHDLDCNKSINSYGLDSMMGAELRNWIFRRYKSDIVVSKILEPKCTLQWLATHLLEGIRQEKA